MCNKAVNYKKTGLYSRDRHNHPDDFQATSSESDLSKLRNYILIDVQGHANIINEL